LNEERWVASGGLSVRPSSFSPERPVSLNQVLRNGILYSSHWRPHPTGHNRPVVVTFQFLLLGRLVIEMSVRYSAIKLSAALPQPGQDLTVEHTNSNGIYGIC